MISDQNLMFLVGVAVLLFAVLVFLFIMIINQRAERKYHRVEMADARAVAKELMDRVMAKDFHDYSVGRHIQNPTSAEELAKILDVTDEDRQDADRLPVT